MHPKVGGYINSWVVEFHVVNFSMSSSSRPFGDSTGHHLLLRHQTPGFQPLLEPRVNFLRCSVWCET